MQICVGHIFVPGIACWLGKIFPLEFLQAIPYKKTNRYSGVVRAPLKVCPFSDKRGWGWYLGYRAPIVLDCFGGFGV
jgi:hypothetical protein